MVNLINVMTEQNKGIKMSAKQVNDIGAAYILERLLKKEKIKVEDILDVISETLGKDFHSEDVAETLKSLKISRGGFLRSILDEGAF